MHDLDERHELVLRVGPVAEVGDGALVDALGHVGEARPHLGDERPVVVDLVHRGHVDPGDRRQLAQHALTRRAPRARPRADHLGDLAHRLLAVADHEGVDEVGHRLGVEGAVPTDDHERVLGPAVLGPDGHPGQVEALEHVGVHELGGEAEGDHVEVTGRVVGVDGEQRHAGGPHLLRSCRSRARRRARPPHRHVRSGSRTGSGAPGWVTRSRRYRDRRGARRCWTAGVPAGGCPAPSRCSEQASRPWPVGARPSATGLTSAPGAYQPTQLSPGGSATVS